MFLQIAKWQKVSWLNVSHFNGKSFISLLLNKDGVTRSWQLLKKSVLWGEKHNREKPEQSEASKASGSYLPAILDKAAASVF